MIMWKLKNFLFRLFHWSFWIEVVHTDWHWDKKLNEILDDPKTFKHIDNYVIRVNGVEIWVQNYPYGYGYVWHDQTKRVTGAPAPLTRIRLSEFITKQHISEMETCTS